MPGTILWEGKSRLDGKPIVVIATPESSNRKTGDLIQTWILRQDIHPVEASQSGEDYSICGNCPHRGTPGIVKGKPTAIGRSCYVILAFGVSQVWQAYKRGNYPVATPDMLKRLCRGKIIRIGAYGDPVAVPIEVWHNILQYGTGHTGYTHQWRNAEPTYAELCMASVDSPVEQIEANALGWKTFRVKLADQSINSDEMVCPASKESTEQRILTGKPATITCEQCKACRGNSAHNNIVIDGHGGIAVLANVQRTLQRIS